MSEAIDWLLGHAMAVIGGTILFVGLMAVWVFASRAEHKRLERDNKDSDPTRGE